MSEENLFPVDPALLAEYRKSVEAGLSNFPRKFKRWYENAGAEERDYWYTERFKCLKYHLYLSGFAEARTDDPSLPKTFMPIMGMDFVPNPHSLLFSQFVQTKPGENFVLSDLEQRFKKMMLLWPRNHMKTSAVVVDTIQKILNYPNIRICFLTGGDKLAKRHLARVKRVFEHPSNAFAWLFPEFCLRDVRNRTIKDENDSRAWTSESAKLGTAHEFTVPCRTNDNLAEPTFAISTARSVKSGSHFDIIYIDDLVNDQNYRSETSLEKCYEDYIQICPLLDPVGFIIMTGTRYSFGDTYGRIQDKAKEEEKQLGRTIWKFSIRDCWSHGCQNCTHTNVYHDYSINILQPPCIVDGCNCLGYKDRGNKDVLFPKSRTRDGREIGFSLESLAAIKQETTAEFFANQYENNPLATEDQTFTETLIGRQTLHHPEQIPPYVASQTFVVGDLAYVGQEGKDFSVLFVCRKFQGQIFIFDCEYGNWDSSKVAENVVNILLRHRPDVMYLEKINGWESFNNNITAYANSLGVPKVPIVWVKGSQAKNAKLMRIGSVKEPLQRKRLWLYALMKGYDILVQQLTKWPKLGRHDDFADTAGMVVAAPTGYEQETPPQPESQINWLHRLTQNNTQPDEETRPAGSYDPNDPTDRWKG